MSTKGVSAIMNLVNSSRRLTMLAGAVALLIAAQPASAQDIAESHVDAARSAIAALGATDAFDNILPQAAQALKTELIRKNPDLQADIIDIVDKTAFAMAARRGDLEREAALAYARVFTEEEMTQVATFYQSDAGKKLITDGPKVMNEVFQAAEIWQNGVARDLARQVAEELTKRHGNSVEAPAEGAPAPEGTEAPAEGATPPEGAEAPASE